MSLKTCTTNTRIDAVTLTLIAAEAAKAWTTFTKDEKTMIRFGIFPMEQMQALEALFDYLPSGDRGRLCAVALMDCAEKDGGMRA